jgi:hypothetical protein
MTFDGEAIMSELAMIELTEFASCMAAVIASLARALMPLASPTEIFSPAA